MTDTTFVTPITNLVTDPVVINWIVTIIIAGLTFVFGLLKIPKNIAAKIVEYGVLIAGAIIHAQGKVYNSEKHTTEAIQQAKLLDAVTTLERDILDSPNKSFFGKVTNVLGGIVPVINFAVPIIKPFIKGKK